MSGSSTLKHGVTGLPIRTPKVEVVGGPDQGLSKTADSELISVGTAKDNDLVLTDPTVSRYHLELRHLGDRILASDLGSTNGTVMGKAILRAAELLPGARVQLGRTTLELGDGDTIGLELYESDALHGMRGRSADVRRLMARVGRVAQSDVSVLLHGETGTGKEVVARAIQSGSKRADQPFETVDCGALAPTLIASELFGHEKGAFTGADRQHIGAFERANGGTLFLDEIGELPSGLQTTLLGALERRSFRRVGGSQPISVDVRLICATNRDLRAEVNSGSFRDDLYYRIAVVRFEIPALRERTDDIPVLVEHFLREAGFDGPVEELFPGPVMDTMLTYRWPGNVRELRNFVEAAIAMGETPGLDRLPSRVERGHSRTHQPESEGVFAASALAELLEMEFKDARASVLAELESEYAKKLMEKTGGNVSKAARVAGIHRTYLIAMLKRHGLK